MKLIYLVQGAAGRLARLQLPKNAIAYALCYDQQRPFPWADASIYDPNSTWAEGRNRLANLAIQKHPDLDYLIMADDDVEFESGSFEIIQDELRRETPSFLTPLTDKVARFDGADTGVTRQRPRVLDEQLVAVGRELLDQRGICPLATKYDSISWHTSCLIFEYLSLTRYAARALQLNTVRVLNRHHNTDDGPTLYRAGEPGESFAAFRDYLDGENIAYDRSILFHLKENQSLVGRQLQQLRRKIGLGAR